MSLCFCGFLPLSSAAQEIDYLRQVKPVLHERCYACHGALKQEGGLRLDTAAAAIRGGDSGAAIQPGNAAASLLLTRITAHEESERMPPEGEPLTAAQIGAIRTWISNKATAPADERPERDPREHWSFKAPVRAAVPTVAAAAWQKNPIDAFLAREHQQRGLTPASIADKRVWLRRVSLDLIGLPPTPEELAAFMADDSPEAYDKVATRLLASPQYGERWGRHWMDIWRYSDAWGLGAELRNSHRHIWHWRDWIIESLNADKGYDQMLREMLAADELYPNDLDRLRASGFLARQYFKFNRTSWLDETVEHTSKAMLGLTFNCAKCHDHKYDPLSQVDYYRMRAIFEPYQVRIDALPGEIDFEKNGIPRAFDCNLTAPTYLHIRGDERNPDKNRVIEPAFPAILAREPARFEAVTLPPEAYEPGLRAHVVAAHVRAAEERIKGGRSTLAATQKRLDELEAAERLAAAKRAEQPPAEEPKPQAKLDPKPDPKPLVRDDFAAPRADVWEEREGKWVYANGKLVQSQVGASRAVLRLKPAVPADFEARLKYIPTGGERWKSVGISFDVTDQGNEVLAYLSSFADGPKSQVAYRAKGDYVYPANSSQSRTIELGQAHELVLRVRGTLVNMQVDGQPSVAYRLPIARQTGRLELIAFDAAAEFLAFELNPLPAAITLLEPAAGAANAPAKQPESGPQSIPQARLQLTLAEQAVLTAEAQLASVHARASADRARHAQPAPADLSALVTAAARSEKQVAAAQTAEGVTKAELALLAAGDKKAEAEKKLAEAKAAHDKALAAVEKPGETYAALAGANKTLESNVETEASRTRPFPTTSTGRRSALARWLTDGQHPLTARVAVNHLWSRHMGRPLVATVFDFGRKGAAPTHPELLDWLAVELVEQGWSMKHLHRLIVTSQAYRLSSSNAAAPAATLAADPENRWYWRANPVRMEAQLVRDSLLHLAGELDLTRGGPPIAVSAPSKRRSLYYVHSHNEHQKFLEMFDDASVLDCYRRSESIVPQQALALENSDLAANAAEKITTRITGAAKQPLSDAEFIRQAFVMVLASEPTEAEQTFVAEMLAKLTAAAQEAKRADAAQRARVHLVHALLNHNDFVTVR